MKIGVFDSGLGGLAIAQSIIRRLPEFDYFLSWRYEACAVR